MYDNRVIYRLFHKRLQKYVAWPHGRQKIIAVGQHTHTKVTLMPMLRLENEAWGGTVDVPVLEVHAITRALGKIVVHDLAEYSAKASSYGRRCNR